MGMTWSFLILLVSEWELWWKDLGRPLQIRPFSTTWHIHYHKLCELASYIPFPGEKNSVISVVSQEDHIYPGNQIKFNAVLELSPL